MSFSGNRLKRRTGTGRRSFEIARGSALACAAIQDVLPVCDAMSADDNRKQKALLDRRVKYRVGQFDTDTDTDPDTD